MLWGSFLLIAVPSTLHSCICILSVVVISSISGGSGLFRHVYPSAIVCSTLVLYLPYAALVDCRAALVPGSTLHA